MPAGRPSDYTEDMANLICDRIAGDESLESICRADDMPGSSTVRQWLRKHPEFAANYARAREEQGHSAADTLSDIRKKVLSGEIPPDVARAAADIAKWESARRAPKHFGDRILHGSDPQNPLPTPAVLDASKLSAQALREVIEAAKANEANPS